jgi:hypothetical protein
VTSPKKPSPRALRRELERTVAKLADARERLARLEPGGTPDHPIDVTSSSQVEVRARAMRCPRCDVTVQLDEHTAETVAGQRLRVARTRCAQCGARRAVYFRLGSGLPS